ncbi:unnamed protein product, partial [Ectocarpus fasciculatus]
RRQRWDGGDAGHGHARARGCGAQCPGVSWLGFFRFVFSDDVLFKLWWICMKVASLVVAEARLPVVAGVYLHPLLILENPQQHLWCAFALHHHHTCVKQASVRRFGVSTLPVLENMR